MRAKRNQRKPIIFGNCKEVLQAVIIIYFAGNVVFGEFEKEESEFCEKGWSEFVKDRKQWERQCRSEDDIKISPCRNETADYLQNRYKEYIKFCPIGVSGNFFIIIYHYTRFCIVQLTHCCRHIEFHCCWVTTVS